MEVKNMKIAIIDDEKAFAERLHSYVLKLFTEKHTAVDVTVTDDSDFILYNGKQYDVILLDIEMPGCSGINLASKLNEQKGGTDKPYIIFVTNCDGLVFDALKQQPFSFVRKSHLDDLKPCFDRLNKLCESDIYYPIKSGRDIERVALKDIFYLEKQKNYVIYHTAHGTISERTTLDKKSDLLNKGFLRTHIGYMVNIRCIEKIQTADISLSDGTIIPLSRKYSEAVRKQFFEWMANEI